jgi:hypothetical protein
MPRGNRGDDDALAQALIEGRLHEDAARMANVSPRTVCRRLADPAFRRRMNELRAMRVMAVADKLRELSGKAVDRLTALLDEGNDKVATTNIRTVLEYLFKGFDTQVLTTMTLENRAELEEVKRELASRGAQPAPRITNLTPDTGGTGNGPIDPERPDERDAPGGNGTGPLAGTDPPQLPPSTDVHNGTASRQDTNGGSEVPLDGFD